VNDHFTLSAAELMCGENETRSSKVDESNKGLMSAAGRRLTCCYVIVILTRLGSCLVRSGLKGFHVIAALVELE
jgi:hypothetical protein